MAVEGHFGASEYKYLTGHKNGSKAAKSGVYRI